MTLGEQVAVPVIVCVHCREELATGERHTAVCEACRDWVHHACESAHRRRAAKKVGQLTLWERAARKVGT